MSSVCFEAHNVEKPPINETAARQWLEAVARNHGMGVGNLCYMFCDDKHILEVNRQFLNHDYFTDIITFDRSTRGRVNGDMVISLDTVASNAERLGEDGSRELLRVVVHGLLHLCGINDKGPGEREVMEQHENQALAMLPGNIYLER